jgi:tRNA nucleotidyltransferase (CCA-adding enzyme)
VKGRISRDVVSALPEEVADLVGRLITESKGMGLTLYLVGGPVRDWLLKREVADIDLLIAGGSEKTPELLARKVSSPRIRIREHRRFGTLTLSVGEHAIDLARMRQEEYVDNGALPKISAGSLEDDMQRRDFSVNALLVPLLDAQDSTAGASADNVIDIVGGIADLEERSLRVLHPQSFHNDPTRALRAARFCSRLDFKLSRGSRSYLRDALRDGAFGAVSGDRLRKEFEKLFAEARRGGSPTTALERLHGWHILGALEPGLTLDPRAKPGLRRLGKILAEPPWRLREYRAWVAGLCLWLAPLTPGMRRRVVKRLSVRGDAGERIVNFAKDQKRWTKALAGTRGRGAVDLVLSDLDEDQLLALCASCKPLLRRRVLRWAAEDRDRRIPVNGRDLLNAKLEGPVVGLALSRIRAAFLDGEVANRAEALALAREIHRQSTPQKSPRRRPPKPKPSQPSANPPSPKTKP